MNDYKITSFADAIEYAFKRISKIRMITIFRTTLFLMVLILLVFSVNVATNKTTVEKLVESLIEKEKEERKDMSIRDMVSPKIQRNLLNLVYTMNCDRAFIIELHNGKKNATELPFKYFDMTYEEVNDNKHSKHVSQYFVNTMVTHYKLPYYLTKNTIFVGTSEELAEIDPRFASNFEEHNGKYLGIIILRNNVEEIGFLGVAYDVKSEPLDRETIYKELVSQAKSFKDLLDLGFQRITIDLKNVNDNG